MSLPERNLPIYLNNFSILINNGHKQWATLCLNPTETDFRRVWNFVLSATLFASDGPIQIVYDLKDVQKAFFIDFEGPVQGFFTWKGRVWDASKYMTYSYTETATTSVILFEFSIPTCQTFTKPSLILFDIYINDAANCGNCPLSSTFPQTVSIPNVTFIQVNDKNDKVVSLPTTNGASSMTSNDSLFVNLPPQTVQGNIYTINLFLCTTGAKQIFIQYTFQQLFTLNFCYFDCNGTSLQPLTDVGNCTITPRSSPNCGQVTLAISYNGTTFTVNATNNQAQELCGTDVLTSNTLNCQSTLTLQPNVETQCSGSYTCTQLNLYKPSGDQTSDVLTLDGNAYLLTIVPNYDLASLVQLVSPINAQYRFQCDAFIVQNMFSFTSSLLSQMNTFNGSFPSLKIFSTGLSIVASPTLRVQDNGPTPLVQFNMIGESIVCQPSFEKGIFSSVVFVFDFYDSYTLYSLDFSPSIDASVAIEALTVVLKPVMKNIGISGVDVQRYITQFLFEGTKATGCTFDGWWYSTDFQPIATSFENTTFDECTFQNCNLDITTQGSNVFSNCVFTNCVLTFNDGNVMTFSNSNFNNCQFLGSLVNTTLDPSVLVVFEACDASNSKGTLNVNDNGLLICSGTVWINKQVYSNPCTWYTLSYTYDSTKYFLGVSPTTTNNTPTIQTVVSSLCYWYIDTNGTIQNVSRSTQNNTNDRSFLIMAGTQANNLNPGLWDACSSSDGQYTNGQCRWIFTQENFLKNQYQKGGKVYLNGDAQSVSSNITGSTIWTTTQVL